MGNSGKAQDAMKEGKWGGVWGAGVGAERGLPGVWVDDGGVEIRRTPRRGLAQYGSAGAAESGGGRGWPGLRETGSGHKASSENTELWAHQRRLC